MTSFVNMNLETGIRYGVINQNEVLQAWADSSEFICPDCDCVDFCECMSGSCAAEYIGGGYQAVCDDIGDIFVMESPFYTYAPLCSPCAPNAVYLADANESGLKGYCFGHDWFEDGVAPYPVYRVSDDSLVGPC